MKKILFALPLMLLAVFFSGCGPTPDEELQSKIPDSTNSLCLVDGNLASRTKLYNDNKKDILKGLKDEKLPEDIFQCRILAFGSTKEEWGGVLIQSANGQVGIIFDRIMSECRKEKANFKGLKEITVNGERRVSCVIEGKTVIAILYHKNLLLIAANKTDPSFFKKSDKPNPLFSDIQWKDHILSSAVKVEIPQQGKNKESADMAFQMVPALQKLTAVSVNIPFSADDPILDFRMIFKDEQSAGEGLAALNMGLGFLAQASKDVTPLINLLKRKTDKNIASISFNINAMTEAAKTAQKNIEQAKKQRAEARKRRQIQRQQAAKKRAAAQQKPAAPTAPAPKQPAVQQKPAAPAKPAAQQPTVKQNAVPAPAATPATSATPAKAEPAK